jgi:hypothetical protein
MHRWDGGRLSEAQAQRVAGWLEAPVLVEDLSWGLVDTAVLRVRTAQGDVVVKAGGPGNHHIGRDITAHESYTDALVERGRAARLRGADRDTNVLALDYLDGSLVEGTQSELAADTHAQAGELLRALHSREARPDDEHEVRATAKALHWLDREHRVEPDVERETRRILRTYRPRTVTTVPTHGDWQPRNWIEHRGTVKVIDFGRFDFRPAATDLCRLAAQQWRRDPSLEAAFLEGYGHDPRDPEVWAIDQLREAVGTAVWAFQVGETAFEAQGHRMLTEALARF